jgi:YidC/Oxa1 family membrane protein insertase
MDTQRVVLFVIFSFSLFLLWDAWQKEQRPATPPSTATDESYVPAPPAGVVAPPPLEQRIAAGDTVSVRTDLIAADISTIGGDIRRLELLRYGQHDEPQQNLVLFQTTPTHTYIAQSGLIGDLLPNHKTRYRASASAFELTEGADALRIVLESTGSDNPVTKVFTFHRGRYLIDVSFEIPNATKETLQPFAYFQFVRDDTAPEGESALIPTYTGVALFTDEEKFQKVPFADIAKGKTPFPAKGDDGWIGMIQHYFVAVWLPPQGTPHEFYTKKLDELYVAGVVVPGPSVAPGDTGQTSMTLYAGPQEHDRLKALEDRAPGLTLTVDYGWLTVIAAPLFWLLAWIYDWVHNWGVAIIILTIMIKAVFYWPSAASYRSMAKMRVVAPKLQKIKEQYGDDKQRLQQAMMDLYRSEKINPLGGCLPILIQIPVFIALYWVLLGSVELRQAPFALWINDLSAPDPYFVLPVLMGISMIIQSRLSPAPPDPVQARIMKIMPIAFSIFFFFFPAGLVLYWLVNNVLSIAQQWSITRTMERESAARARR